MLKSFAQITYRASDLLGEINYLFQMAAGVVL